MTSMQRDVHFLLEWPPWPDANLSIDTSRSAPVLLLYLPHPPDPISPTLTEAIVAGTPSVVRRYSTPQASPAGTVQA